MEEFFDGAGRATGKALTDYDARGLVTHRAFHDGSGNLLATVEFQYDGCGNEVFYHRADASSSVVEAAENGYREDGLLERSSFWPSASGTCETTSFEYKMDDRGRIASATPSVLTRKGSEVFVYNGVNQVIERDWLIDSLTGVALYEYHSNGALRSSSWRAPVNGYYSRRDFDPLGYPVRSEGDSGQEVWIYDASHRVTEHDAWSSINGRCGSSVTFTSCSYDASGSLVRDVATRKVDCSADKVLTTTYTRPDPATVIGETRDQAGAFVRRTRTVTDDRGMVTESDRDLDGNGFKSVFKRDYSCWVSPSGAPNH
jgi:hypothetical protein